MSFSIYGFLFGMWVLMLLGGGIVVTVLGPFDITGFGDANWIFSSSIKAIIAIILVVLWIVVLSKMKDWIFRKELRS